MADDDLDLDLLASSLQADTTDVRILLKALVTRLSGALGARLDVERSGGVFKRGEEIKRVRIDLGDDQLEAAVNGSRLDCTIGRVSGGIRIRSTRVTTEEWLHQLLGALGTEAAHSEATRQALENLVIGEA